MNFQRKTLPQITLIFNELNRPLVKYLLTEIMILRVSYILCRTLGLETVHENGILLLVQKRKENPIFPTFGNVYSYASGLILTDHFRRGSRPLRSLRSLTAGSYIQFFFFSFHLTKRLDRGPHW